MVGADLQVINAAVGGYGSEQIWKVAKNKEFIEQGNLLVAIICENDFLGGDDEFDLEAYVNFLERLNTLKMSKSYTDVVVVLQSYIYRNFPEIVGQPRVWRKSDAQYRKAQEISVSFAKKNDMAYVDWSKFIDRNKVERHSIFSGLQYYFDKVHLSPEGNHKMAQLIFNELDGRY